MRLRDHPTVQAYQKKKDTQTVHPEMFEAKWLKDQAISAGADDVGLIDLEKESMADFREDLLYAMPDARTVLVTAFRMNQNTLKSPAHSVANIEFKHTWMHANDTAIRLVRRLNEHGIKAINMPAGFPFEAKRWPGKMWLTCDKIFAVEAGLGHMGWNRILLHPRFGAAVILGSVLISETCDHYDRPLEFNPCLKCGMCVKVCPVGAVKQHDDFNFMACYSHNYRERLGGFQDWVEKLADSRNHADYRRRVSDSETISMWQNLSIGAQTRCDRCVAVCPAGEESLGEYLDDPKEYLHRNVKFFEQMEETVYVVKGSDAEQHVIECFPAKTPRRISNGIRPDSARGFLGSLPIAFQPNQSEGLDATYHFTFFGKENLEGTVVIGDKRIEVKRGLVGTPDLHVTADSRTWTDFLAREKNLVWALITRKIRLKGSPKLMKAFADCFPG
ncbi:4Fe-4S binding protein [Thermodesulfobacteriota bacterium]